MTTEEKIKLATAFEIINDALIDWENGLCPDWKNCPMPKLEKAEKRAVETWKKFNDLKDILL